MAARSDRHSIRDAALRAAGPLLYRPWTDWAVLAALSHCYFPASRAWAAAEEARRDPQRFAEAIPMEPPQSRSARHMIERALDAAAERGRSYERLEQQWQALFFAREEPQASRLRRLHHARSLAAWNHFLVRRAFMPLVLGRRIPAVRWDIVPEEEFEALLGGLSRPCGGSLTHEGGLSLHHVRRSHAMIDDQGIRRYWINADGQGEDRLWAQVAEPEGLRDPPTLVFLNGFGADTDIEASRIDPMEGLLRFGFRLVRPDGPWHGRRRVAGHYSGEPVLARAPLGLVDYLRRHALEAVRLVAWARRQGRGPVALGGVSLGALTAQLALGRDCEWPAVAQPDAAFLVAGAGDLSRLAFSSGFSRALGLAEALRHAGWDEKAFRRWDSLVRPADGPSLPPKRIVVALGRADGVCPFVGAKALAQRWKLPRENLFEKWQGHFTAYLGLTRDHRPFKRLADVLNAPGSL